MALRIAQLGQPVLRRVAAPVPSELIDTPQFQQFLAAMRDTLYEAGGVGLAAPQVFTSLRVFLACVHIPEDEVEELPLEVFINPVLVEIAAEKESAWEGCLSFAELKVLVPRFRQVRIEYLNERGEAKVLDLEDFPARVVQHEFDHLQGILTIDRAVSTRHIIKASEFEVLQEEDSLEAE